ncbi:hypothetical protein L195_g040801, partial [Trifolium pratense]
EMFKNADHDMKVHIKERFRQFVYPETTTMCPPPSQVKTKGASRGWANRPSCTPEERSTKRSPSLFEHAESRHDQSQLSEGRQKSSRKCSQSSPNPARVPKTKPSWPNLGQLPLFMHPFIENVQDFEPDGHCGFRAVARLIGESADSHSMIRLDLSIELEKNKKRYIEVFGSEEKYNVINYAIIPETLGPVLEDKYAVDLLTGNGISETYFPLEGEPSCRDKLMCLGWVNRNHFMQVTLKLDNPIPPTNKMWVQHHLKSAHNWPSRYAHRMEKYTKLKLAHDGPVVRDKIKVLIPLDDDSVADDLFDADLTND